MLRLSFALFIGSLSITCFSIDPIQDYRTYLPVGSETASVLCVWTADIQGNGKPLEFISAKQEYDEDKRNGSFPSWRIYLPTQERNSYIPSKGTEDGQDFTEVNDISVDPERVYIGPIQQLGKRGIVTMQLDFGKKGAPSMAYIHAYTIEGDHVKHVILATYDYDAEKKNAIYDQYLSDAKRTKIKIQELKPYTK